MRLCSTSHTAVFWWFVEATCLAVDSFGCHLMPDLGMILTHCRRLFYALCKQAWERLPHATWAQSYRPRPLYCSVRYTLQYRGYTPARRGACSVHAGTVRWRCMENECKCFGRQFSHKFKPKRKPTLGFKSCSMCVRIIDLHTPPYSLPHLQ